MQGTSTSTRYANVSKNLNEIVDALLKNKELLRWIGYLDDDPLNKGKPDVPQKAILGKNIVLTRVNNEILKEAKVKVFISPAGGSDVRNSVLLSTTFQVDITMPTKDGYIYPLRIDRYTTIASEIAKTIDGKHITGVGEAKVSTGFNMYKINEQYSGMMMHITVANSGMRENEY